jgi:hypothetical protein
MESEVQADPSAALAHPVVEFSTLGKSHRISFRGNLTLREAGDLWNHVTEHV